MNFLPIVERELRVATRRRATYWSRVGAAVAGVGLTAWMLQTLGTIAPPYLVGLALFRVVSGLGLFFSLFTGLVLTADSLSQEKREGTLGLLFLTELKGYDVALGKLFGTSIAPFCALLALVPVLALPLVLGGVTVLEFWRTAAALTNAMFFSLAAGLCVSAVSWHLQRAVLGTGLLVAVAWVLSAVPPPFVYLSPVTAFRAAFDASFTRQPERFFVSIALTQTLSWLLLVLASRWAARRWQQRPAKARAPKGFPGGQPPTNEKSSAIGERDPAAWLASKGIQQRWVWGSLGLTVLGWAVVSMIGAARGALPFACLLGAAAIEVVLQFWIAWEAGRRFGEERRTGILETLLVSPLAVEDIVRAHLESLRRQFIWPVIGVVAFQFFLLVLGATRHRWSPEDFPPFMAIMFTAMIWTCVTAYALAWVGLWLGLAARKTIDAGVGALLWVVAAPLAVFMGSSFFLFLTGSRSLQGPTMLAVLLIIVGSVSAHLSAESARTKLLSRFRPLAAGDADFSRTRRHSAGVTRALDQTTPGIPKSVI